MVYEILGTDWIKTRGGDELLIHNLRVASVYECRPDPDAAKDAKYADPHEPYKPGDTCVFSVNLGFQDTWARNLKTFIVGVDPDCSDDEIDDFANECYPPDVPELDDVIDDLFDGRLILRDEDDREIKVEDEDHAEELARDHIRALQAWESPIAGLFVHGETWRNSGGHWVNSRWRPATEEELDELGYDALKDERRRGRSSRRDRDDEPDRGRRGGRGRGRDRDDEDPDDKGDDDRDEGRGRGRRGARRGGRSDERGRGRGRGRSRTDNDGDGDD